MKNPTLKMAIALVAGLSASVSIAAPKSVDVSQGREGIGKNVIFLNGDKINIKAETAASQNAKVRLLASCVQSALKCANVVTPPGGGDDVVVTPPGGGDDVVVTPPGGSDDVVVTPPGGGDDVVVTPPTGGNDNNTGGGVVTGPKGPVVDTPSLVGIVARDANSNDVAAACVQDESFCKDANLKRVANRNSVIDEIFFYTEL